MSRRFSRWRGSSSLSRGYGARKFSRGRNRIMASRRRYDARLWNRQRRYQSQGTRALILINKFKREEEKKIVQGTIANQVAAAGNAGTVLLLNGIDQGQTVGTRIGNKATMTSLAIRINMKAVGVETGFSTRIMIVYDNRPNGVAMTWSGANGLCSDGDMNSLYDSNTVKQGRFKVMYDKTFNFRGTETCQSTKMYWKGTMSSNYSLAQAGDITDISKRSIYILTNATRNVGIVHFNGKWKLRFTDA